MTLKHNDLVALLERVAMGIVFQADVEQAINALHSPGADGSTLMPNESMRPAHSCVPIARAPFMEEGRDWWIGKLTASVPEWPKETHCLHMTTPLKDVVFLCNRGDFEALATLSACYFGHPINESWMSSMLNLAQIAVARKGK